jgi:hypothetical protein
VQIEKKQNHSTPSSSAAKSSGAKVAQEYAALFSTRLALARWTRGGDIPHVHCFEHQLPMRAAWYEQARRQFQAWLESGGFHQPEPDGLESVIAETTPQAGRDTGLSKTCVVHGSRRSVPHPSALPSGAAPAMPLARPTPPEAHRPGYEQDEVKRQDPDDGRQK